MDVLHISTECYPAAKAGGLGDFVGALPKYLAAQGVSAGAVVPKYDTPWIRQRPFVGVFEGAVRLHDEHVPFTIEKEENDTLGFPLFVADIPGKFDRPGVYSDPSGAHYGDEVERYVSFQLAVLQWLLQASSAPSVLHCHDHHTGLIPFMIKHCPDYRSLGQIPTVFTIHNGAYHGDFGWDKLRLLPRFDYGAHVLLDWNHFINPLATGVKAAWRVTTVSRGYLGELMERAGGLERLFRAERNKCVGITNGIDSEVWDPATDELLAHRLGGDDWAGFKASNKAALRERYPLDMSRPLITFIGRLVTEKGADMLPDLIRRASAEGLPVSFALLGTGEAWLHHRLSQLEQELPGRVGVVLAYDEGLAHQLFAGSDFLIMPSRIEPCGLNQLYAMRYGTIPVVRAVGGLKDTVPDIGEPDGAGRGIQFTHFTVDDAYLAVYRASLLYQDQALFQTIRRRITRIDNSWERAARDYVDMYEQLSTIASHYVR